MTSPDPMRPLVVDCFSGEVVKDWKAVFDSGIRGVIHKATEGSNYVDKTFVDRKDRIRKAGLLLGAYHFLTNSDVAAQVEHFLDVVKPDEHTLLALDFEEYKSRTASLEQAREFLQLVFEKTGQRPVLYSGNLIKEQLRKPDAFFNAHRLWLAHYNRVPALPPGWEHYWLHQYTGDGIGPPPHEVSGIDTKGIDLNVFGGADLAAEWAPKGDVHVATMTAPEESRLETTEHAPEPAAADSKRWWSGYSFAQLNDLADQGSRAAEHIKNGKAALKTTAGTVATVAAGGATLIDPDKGQAAIGASWASQHPFLLALICITIVTVVLGGLALWYLKKTEKGLLSAYKDGRYRPRGADVSRETVQVTKGA